MQQTKALYKKPTPETKRPTAREIIKKKRTFFLLVTLNSPDSRHSQKGLYEQVKPDAGSKIIMLLRIPCSNNVRGSSTLKLMSVRKRVGKVP